MMKESPTQKRILLDCGHGDTRLFRQNVGKTWIGESKYYNRRETVVVNRGDVVIRQARRFIAGIKGMSDLIGWHSVIIIPEMLGQKIAIYTGFEVKGDRGRATPDQLQFISLVKNAGGIAGVVKSPEDARELLSVDKFAYTR